MLPLGPTFATGQCVELDLLCESARVFLCCEDGAGFRALLKQKISQPFDWSALERTAERHAMTSLFAAALTRWGENVIPPEIGERFYKLLRLNACKNLVYVAEWRRLLSAFHAAGIPVISMKGPSLALRVHASLALRDFADLDLLVRRKDVIIARRVLAAEGYKLCSAVADDTDAALLRSENCQLNFVNHDRRTAVDLHWAMVHKMFSFHLPTEALFESAQTERQEGFPFLSLSPEYLLLYLCAHGTKHCWTRLRWLCDVAFCLRSVQDLDWSLCFSLARTTRCDLVLKHSLLLTAQILRLDLPLLARNYCNSGEARKLAGFARTFLFKEEDRQDRVEELHYYLAFANGWRDCARLLFQRFFVPTETEWEHIRLPRMLYYLYYAIRPTRFLWSYFFKAAARSRGCSDPV
jgi:hypothetical protein